MVTDDYRTITGEIKGKRDISPWHKPRIADVEIGECILRVQQEVRIPMTIA